MITLKHHKQSILDHILVKRDPNDRHIKEWTAPDIQVRRMLRDMVRDQLVTIEYLKVGGTVKRYITACVTQIRD
jgi:hypothetical protein